MMMDIFSGVMSGSAFAGDVKDQYKNMEESQNVGHWSFVFKPHVFLDGGVVEFRERMDDLLKKTRAVKKAEGFDRIFTSGEPESGTEKHRRISGIPFTKGEIDALHELASKSGAGLRLEILENG